jgi:hypothetical protein
MTKTVPYSTAVLVGDMKDKGDIVYARADIRGEGLHKALS